MTYRVQNKCLIVSYYFSPYGGTGAKRATLLAEKLVEMGWQVRVLAADHKVQPAPVDPRAKPHAMKVCRVLDPEPREIIARLVNGISFRPEDLPENSSRLLRGINRVAYYMRDRHQFLWGLVAGLTFATRSDFCPDIVWSTSPPGGALIAGWIVSCLTKAKLIMDFRDPWLAGEYRWMRKGRETLDQILLQAILKKSSAITTINKEVIEYTLCKIGVSASELLDKVAIVPNGFDPGLYMQREAVRFADCNQLLFIYAGYMDGHLPQAQRFHDPAVFLEPLSNLINRKVVDPGRICIVHFGSGSFIPKDIKNPEVVRPLIRQAGWVPPEEIARYLKGADVLLLIGRRWQKFVYSGRLFDYLGARRPILACVPLESAAGRLIKEAKAGWVVPPDQPAMIEETLLHIYTQWLRHRDLGISYDSSPWNWDRLAKRMETIFRSVL